MVVIPREILIIDCHWCKAKVGAAVSGEVVIPEEVNVCDPVRVVIAQCPKCKSALVGTQLCSPGEEMGDAERVWPAPPLGLSLNVPVQIQQSLLEAHHCLEGRNYTASVAMSGRALEGVVRHFTTPTTGLQQGISELHSQGLIDDRLNKWAEALHLERNDAAHFSGQTFRQQDAEDIFKFTNNICEYVFVLSVEFDKFMQRKARKKARS